MEKIEKLSNDRITLNVYNQDFSTKKIDLLSDEHEKHTGVLSCRKDSELKDELDYFKKGERNVDLIRVQTVDIKKLMFNGMFLNGKKIMYMEFFSKLQFQSGIIDYDLTKIKDFKKLNTFEVELCSDTNAVFSVFSREKENSTNIGLYNSSKDKENISDRLCIIAKNKKDVPLNVNLFDMSYENGYEDSEIKVEVPINDNGFFTTSYIRCFSENQKQLTGDISISGNKISQSMFWSANQFQSTCIDTEILEFDVFFGGNFEVNLLPNSKVMYIFYKKW